MRLDPDTYSNTNAYSDTNTNTNADPNTDTYAYTELRLQSVSGRDERRQLEHRRDPDLGDGHIGIGDTGHAVA